MVKKKADVWPELCCGVCLYWHMTDNQDQSGPCFAYPPQLVYDGEYVIGVRPILEAVEPSCMFFSPKHHG